MILPACVVVMAIAAVLFYFGAAEPVTCRWERNPEFPRWETQCDDMIAMVNHKIIEEGFWKVAEAVSGKQQF